MKSFLQRFRRQGRDEDPASDGVSAEGNDDGSADPKPRSDPADHKDLEHADRSAKKKKDKHKHKHKHKKKRASSSGPDKATPATDGQTGFTETGQAAAATGDGPPGPGSAAGVESLSRDDLLGLSLKLSSQNAQLRKKQESLVKKGRRAEELTQSLYKVLKDICDALPVQQVPGPVFHSATVHESNLEDVREVAMAHCRAAAAQMQQSKEDELRWGEKEAAYQSSLQTANNSLRHAEERLKAQALALQRAEAAAMEARSTSVTADSADAGTTLPATSSTPAKNGEGCDAAGPVDVQVGAGVEPEAARSGDISTAALRADAGSTPGPAAEEELAKLRSEVAKLNDRHILAIEDYKRSQLRCQQVQFNLDQCLADKEHLQRRIAAMEQKLAAGVESLRQCQEEADTQQTRHEEQLVDLKLRLSGRAQEVRNCEETIAKLRQELENSATAASSAQADQAKVKQSFGAMDAEVRALEEKLHAEREANKDRLQQIDILSMRLADSTEQAEERAIEADNLRDEVAALKANVKQLTKQHRSAVAKLAGQSADLESARREAQQAREEMQAHAEDQAAAEEQKAAAAAELAEKSRAELEAATATVAALEARVITLDERASELTAELQEKQQESVARQESLQRSLASTKKELASSQARAAALTEEVASLSSEIASGKPSERKILAFAKEQAERDQRMVRQSEHLQRLHAKLVQVCDAAPSTSCSPSPTLLLRLLKLHFCCGVLRS